MQRFGARRWAGWADLDGMGSPSSWILKELFADHDSVQITIRSLLGR